MYCPLCGGKLSVVEKNEPDSDYDDPRSYEPDNSIWWKCTHCNSFGDSFPLQQHHPFGGINSRPGDSWSLSWVK